MGFALLAGVAQAKAPTETDRFSQVRRGEVLFVRVLGDPKLSANYIVQSDGRIYFDPSYTTLAEGLLVEGKTAQVVRGELSAFLARYIKNPSVTVERQALMPADVTELMAGEIPDSVGIFGDFGDKGGLATKVTPWRKGMKVLDLILALGATTSNANWAKARLIRKNTLQVLNLQELMSGESLDNNRTLKPGDKLYVPAVRPRQSLKAMAMGSVNRQGAFTLEEGARVLDLLLAAGGSTGRAAVSKTFLLRGVGGKPKVLPVDIKRITKLGDLTQNIPLHEGDVLFIPETGRANVKEIINALVDISILRNRASDVAGDIQKVLGEVGNQ